MKRGNFISHLLRLGGGVLVDCLVNFDKTFEITYVRLKFRSSRPESFAIYRRRIDTAPPHPPSHHYSPDPHYPPPAPPDWTPYQFYSSSCVTTYGLEAGSIFREGGEDRAVCREDFSDISPLTGGSVAFSTLEGRPSAYDFENSPVLQDWVTATDIRVVLNRLNTFRDEVFGDPNVLRSYFYAISDFAVGGRCKCNGHASECTAPSPPEGEWLGDAVPRLACRCEHHTGGADCERCLPFYNDAPWGRATAHSAHECSACDCSGKSEQCYFDPELFARTGHGGHCVDCRDYATGPHCERCMEGFYLQAGQGQQGVGPVGQCLPCYCHPHGSESSQCDAYGGCRCREGVMGERCDQCQPHYHSLGPGGCRPCECVMEGSEHNQPQCRPDSGQCRCKQHVDGLNCDTCKPGYFALSVEDPLGCTACFCHGHSSACQSSEDFVDFAIRSVFTADSEGWRAETVSGLAVPLVYNEVRGPYNEVTGSVGVAERDDDDIYFIAPGLAEIR